MALACRYATVPADGDRPLGNPHRSTHETRRAVLLCFYREHLVALHGFIKKTRATPDEDLALARKRQMELMR
jgi:phage-related protein